MAALALENGRGLDPNPHSLPHLLFPPRECDAYFVLCKIRCVWAYENVGSDWEQRREKIIYQGAVFCFTRLCFNEETSEPLTITQTEAEVLGGKPCGRHGNSCCLCHSLAVSQVRTHLLFQQGAGGIGKHKSRKLSNKQGQRKRTFCRGTDPGIRGSRLKSVHTMLSIVLSWSYESKFGNFFVLNEAIRPPKLENHSSTHEILLVLMYATIQFVKNFLIW